MEKKEAGFVAREEEINKQKAEVAKLNQTEGAGTGENFWFDLRTSKRFSFENC